MRSRGWATIAVIAGLVWLASALIVMSADWYLACTVDGQRLGGIDCFQANAAPRTDSAPARWIGFVPLAAAWLVATAVLLACVLAWVRRSRRTHRSTSVEWTGRRFSPNPAGRRRRLRMVVQRRSRCPRSGAAAERPGEAVPARVPVPQVPAMRRWGCSASSRTVARVRVEESVEIARSPEEVWALVADPVNDPRWCRKIKSVEHSGPRKWRAVHKPVPLRPPAELWLEHLELDAPSRLTMREQDEASVFDVEYRLEPTPTGTRFTQVSDFEFKKLPRVLHKTFGHGVRRDVRAQLRALKELLEGGRQT